MDGNAQSIYGMTSASSYLRRQLDEGARGIPGSSSMMPIDGLS
jgi:hypothetical protein